MSFGGLSRPVFLSVPSQAWCARLAFGVAVAISGCSCSRRSLESIALLGADVGLPPRSIIASVSSDTLFLTV